MNFTKNNKLGAIIGILIIVVIYLGVRVNLLSANLTTAQGRIDSFNTNTQVIVFTKMFVDKVLMATSTVNFDTRLQLENAVRDIKDDSILKQWDDFVASKSEADAQEQVKRLLSTLINKIQPSAR